MLPQPGAGEDRLSPAMSSSRALVLGFVRRYLQQHHHSPSYGEIAAALGLSRQRARKLAQLLVRDGLLLKTPGRRGLSLPQEREAAIRTLRALGFVVDEDIGRVGLPNDTLLPPPELDYPEADAENPPQARRRA